MVALDKRMVLGIPVVLERQVILGNCQDQVDHLVALVVALEGN